MNNKPDVPHYVQCGKIQPIDFMESAFTPEEYAGFLRGQVIKYISRFRHSGRSIEDLTKAQTYLGWLKEYCEKLPNKGNHV